MNIVDKKKYENVHNLLCYAIYEADRAYNKFYQKALKEFELTYPQYVILLELWQEDHQTLKKLSEKTDLKSNTLTPLLRRLEERNWITREQPETDKRHLIAHLTEKAKNEKYNVMNSVLNYANLGEDICDSFEEYDFLVEKLHKISENLKKIINV